MVAASGQQLYYGILINGQNGTQLYDPFNWTQPNVQGALELGLPAGLGAYQSAAVGHGGLLVLLIPLHSAARKALGSRCIDLVQLRFQEAISDYERLHGRPYVTAARRYRAVLYIIAKNALLSASKKP